MQHRLDAGLLNRRVKVHLVGMGGNGAQMAACLARLDIALRALGHPEGLHVTAFDDDFVSEANIGRQLYSPVDVGLHKSIVTINRLNQFYGLDWNAVPRRYEYEFSAHRSQARADMVISCVDTRAARQNLHEYLFQRGGIRYWLDLGNTEDSAQVVLGEPTVRHRKQDGCPRLPCVTELFPELLVATPEHHQPSCSVRISLASQGLFVNDLVVRFAAQLLYELFTQGALTQHGVIMNLAAKRSGPIEIDPEVWQRFGFNHET